MNTTLENKNFFQKHLPKSKGDWKKYIKLTIPVITAELIFSLTGFVDNFMVTHIPNGVNALSYANTWTGIIMTIFITINIIASMLVGQFYGSKQYSNLNQIMALRVWTYLVISLAFAIPAWVIPTQMIQIVGPGDDAALEASKRYLKLVAFAWICLGFAWNTNGVLNETGKSLYGMYTAICNILINVIINAILLFGFKMGVEAAAWGTIASAFISIFLDSAWMILREKQIWINPLNLFYITSYIAKIYFARIFAFAVAVSAMIVLPLRMVIWNRAFPPGNVGDQYMRLSASSVLSLTESIASVFSATTAACGANVSVFVASRLGQGKFDEAEQHALALKGFHTIVGVVFSFLLFIFAIIVYFTGALTSGIQTEVHNRLSQYSLEQLQAMTNININEKSSLILQAAKNAAKIESKYLLITLIGIGVFAPLWDWFYTTSAIISSGGRSTLSSFTSLISQWTHFIYLIILGFVIVPKFDLSLPLTYVLFYCWDIVRLAIYEFVQHKFKWKVNIAHNIEVKETIL